MNAAKRFLLTQYGTNKTIEIRAFEVREGYFQVASIKESSNIQNPIDVTSALGVRVGEFFVESELTTFATEQGYQFGEFLPSTSTVTSNAGLAAPINLEAADGAGAGDVDLSWSNNVNLEGTPCRTRRVLLFTAIGTMGDTLKLEAKNGSRIYATILSTYTFAATLASVTATRDFVLGLLNADEDLAAEGWVFSTNGAASINVDTPESYSKVPKAVWNLTVTKTGTVAATGGLFDTIPETETSVDIATNPDFTGAVTQQDSTPGLSTYTAAGLNSGTVYYFRVRQERNGISTGKSNVVMWTAP